MAVQTVEQIERLPPYMEGLQKRLLQSVFGTFDGEDQKTPGLIDKPITLPDFQIAGMDPLQQMALSYAPQMFGSFQPYMQGAQAQIGSGLGTLGAASTGIGAGLGQLADPSESVKRFFDPFQEQVIQQAEKDIERDADLRSQKLLSGLQGQGQGIGSGQRSGRSAVLEAELARNTADQKARTLSGLRSGGFRDAMTNMLRSSQLLGGLGGALGQVGGMYNQFAGTTGDLGRLTSELGRSDLGTLMNLGQFGRGFQQQVLDANRQNLMQGIMEPFTRLQLGSNFLTGMPSSGIASTFKSVTTPDPNPFLSGVGAYTALQGVKPRDTSA
tara:strand:+ start:562 stop:1542 length:981 start_codon:yes stop_codon:yes gene_type:complete